MARAGKNAESRPPASRQKARRGAQEGREARWRRLSRQWEASGLTQREFCEQQKVSLVSLCWWRCELARRDRERATASHPNQWAARKHAGARLAAGPAAQEAAPSAAAISKRKRTKSGKRNEARREEAHVLPALPGQGTQTKNPFIPVQLIGPSFSAAPCPPVVGAPAALEVVLASGRCIRIHGDFAAALLQKLIAVLEASPC